MSDAADWTSFYLMVGGAAAALTGLIFVAITIHTRPIMSDIIHRDRAWSSIAILAAQVTIAAAVLVPAQPVRLLGLEVALIGTYWIYRTLRALRDLGPSMRAQVRPSVRWQVEWAFWIVWVAAFVGAAIALLVDSGAVGFPLLALAMVGMIAFAIWNAWVLISEVSD